MGITIKKCKASLFRPRWLLAAITVLAAACLLSACSPLAPPADTAGPAGETPFALRPQNEKYFREDEWVHLITLAITHSDQRSRIWEAIPASQRAEITQADFFRYISFLAECLPGTISSFHRASQEESELMRGYASKSEKHLTPKPGDTSIWWIKARTSDLRELAFAIPLTLDEADIPYFSKSWLQKQAVLYDYIVLYLDAIETSSQKALTALLGHNTEIRTQAQRAAIQKRTGDLLRYYRNQVVMGKGSYRCIEMMPGRAVVEQLSFPADAGAGNSRTVVFTESDGRFRADEKIPQTLKPNDTVLFFEANRLFAQRGMDVQITSDAALDQLGIPLNLEAVDHENEQGPLFRATWPGLVVEFAGSCQPESLTFEGKVHQIFISYSRFETGSGLRPGLSIHELYLRYPFVRENGYLVQLLEEGLLTTLAFQVESDYIARMSLIFD